MFPQNACDSTTDHACCKSKISLTPAHVAKKIGDAFSCCRGITVKVVSSYDRERSALDPGNDHRHHKARDCRANRSEPTPKLLRQVCDQPRYPDMLVTATSLKARFHVVR